MLKKSFMFLVIIGFFVITTNAHAALNAYLYMIGNKTGQIKGSVTQKGRENSIMVIAYSHNISVPIDTASRLQPGKFAHAPLMITKEVDKSTPLLYSMLVNNEGIKDFRLEFWQPSGSGKEQQHFTIRLTNAHIVSIRSEMLNNKYPENMQHKEREVISFSYEKITWIIMDGGITASADWSGGLK